MNITPQYEPDDFVVMLFCELSGLIKHRERYQNNPDAAIHFHAKIHQTIWILGEYTGWGELRAASEFERWEETRTSS